MPMDFVTQNALLIVLVITSGLGLLWPGMMRQAGNAVSPAQATMLINREDALVLDVREAGEFVEGHLPDARNIPVAKLSERISELEKFKDKAILVCCATGMRSNKASAELKKQGFAKISNLAGGVDAWVGAGYPVKKGKAAK
jgi:rhodanese-related sulfurtransferase